MPDGNRRFGRKHGLQEGEAHHIGLASLIPILKYCHELNVRCVSLYGFCTDNFKRKPSEVQLIMDLIQQNAEALVDDSSMVNRPGIRVEFLGKLDLLDESTRAGMERVKGAARKNDRIVLLVCIACSSTQETVNSVQSTCFERVAESKGEIGGEDGCMSPQDLDRRVYFPCYPHPDLLIRTSGETRLSNFMLWQTGCCLLYVPGC